jgi:hypothetical protein
MATLGKEIAYRIENTYMRLRNFSAWALVLALVFGFVSSCKKSVVGTSATASTDSSAAFSATIAGVTWNSDSVTAVLVNGRGPGDKWMTISGWSSARLISISLHDTSTATDSTITIGQYLVDAGPEAAGFGYASDKILIGRDSIWSRSGVARSGQATVTALDAAKKSVSGTFNFTARIVVVDSLGLHADSVVVTNGLFKNIPYKVRHHDND